MPFVMYGYPMRNIYLLLRLYCFYLGIYEQWIIYNCRFYKEINNAIILIDRNKAAIKIKQRARHIMSIRDYTDFDGLQIRRSHRLRRGYMFVGIGECADGEPLQGSWIIGQSVPGVCTLGYFWEILTGLGSTSFKD